MTAAQVHLMALHAAAKHSCKPFGIVYVTQDALHRWQYLGAYCEAQATCSGA